MRVSIVFICMLKSFLAFSQSMLLLGEADTKLVKQDFITPGSNFSRDGAVDYSATKYGWLPATGNQKNKTSSWAWAAAYLVTSFDRKKGILKAGEYYSPEFIYQKYKKEGSGCRGINAANEILEKALNEGILLNSDFPSSESCDITISESNKKKAEGNVKNYFIKYAKDLNGIIHVLKEKQQPLLISMQVDNYFRTSGNITRESPWWRNPKDDYAGNHAMLVVGYDNAKQALKMMSSHGAAFGENGCVWIPYSTIENTSYFRYACYLEKGYDSYLAAQEQRNDNPFYTLSGKVSKILHPPSLSLSSDEYFLKEGYYKAFENIKIVLADFNPDSESAIIQIRDDNYNYLKSFNIERIGSSHTFHIGEETYRFSFTNIINANILPFKKAIAFTVEKL